MRFRLTAITLLAAVMPLGIGSSVISERLRQPEPPPQYGGALIASESKPVAGEPMLDAAKRVTKKPFGIYITPETSPVQPDIFFGFHSGVDFETTPAEQDTDVSFYAICDGSLVYKKWASGYGGLVVERCTIDGQPAVVTYGHIDLESVTANAGVSLKTGDKIGLLGKGFSPATDGRRKHLHLGIHRGEELITKGYVATTTDLESYIDFNTLYHPEH